MKHTKLIALVLVLLMMLTMMFTACDLSDIFNPNPNPGPDGPDGPQTPTECTQVCPSCGKCTDSACTQTGHEEKCTGHDSAREKHLILDEVGDYGGTYNRVKYGEGAPLNGELDTENDPYYTVHDYYTMQSTDTRILMSGFAPYQQTMADSDGIACALMIFNNEGKDIYGDYSEVALVDKYEELTKKEIYKAGTTSDGLAKLFQSFGMTAYNGNIDAPTSNVDFPEWIQGLLADNQYLMVHWQSGLNACWMIVIGYDTMGTDSINDDVIIFANPFDAMDHFQDGYYIYHFARFFKWWRDMGHEGTANAKTGTAVANKECVIISSETTFDIEKGAGADPVHNYPEVAELHRLLNADGTIGGYYGDGRYSMKAPYSGKTGYDPAVRQATEHVDYSYFTFPDYYNMEDNESRLICTGYMAYTQTMASSCGICSTMSILEYYGYDWVSICDLITRTDWYGYESDPDKKFGPIPANDYGMKQEAIATLYMQGDSAFDGQPCTKFYSYGGVGSTKLYKVPQKLGYHVYDYGGYSKVSSMPWKTYEAYLAYMKPHLAKDEPMVIGWNPTGGHYEVVMCIDDMGTASIYDDVVVLGDSSDGVDHYKDGFNTLPAVLFYGTWYNGSGSWNQQYVMFGRKDAK